jgi:hypothetical protein
MHSHGLFVIHNTARLALKLLSNRTTHLEQIKYILHNVKASLILAIEHKFISGFIMQRSEPYQLGICA